MEVVLTTPNLTNFEYTPPPTSTRAQQAAGTGIIPINYWSNTMANIFSVASKSICKMITVIDRVSDIALNITDAGVAGSEIVKEQVEGYRDTERELIRAKLEMTKAKMAKLQTEGKALTQDNLDAIEL